MKKKNH